MVAEVTMAMVAEVTVVMVVLEMSGGDGSVGGDDGDGGGGDDGDGGRGDDGDGGRGDDGDDVAGGGDGVMRGACMYTPV
ncbi:hypothetical protein NN561_004160 [Cricetulus griseus]